MSLLNHLRYRLKKNKGEGLVHDNKNKLLSFNNFGKGCHGLLDSNIFYSQPWDGNRHILLLYEEAVYQCYEND